MKNKILLFYLLLSLAGYAAIKIITLPPALETARLVEIPEGYTAVEIAKLLEDKNIIKKAEWFLYWTNRYRVQKKLKAGIYEFSGRTPLKAVISKLLKGEVTLVRVLIPEGFTIKEIAAVLEKKELSKKEDFIRYAEAKNLEGFLFPDTYFFPHNISLEAISSTMFRKFKEVFQDIYGEPVTDENFSKVKNIVIVASIVEKEAMYKNEKEIIAGIIYKRIKKNMPIQSCATVIYALGQPKTRLYYKDLRVASPYNTYIHKGLPPGPIANPGRTAIEAAVNPKKTDYLFFVSMGDGRNHFSKTYKDHQSAIQQFLLPNTQPETDIKESTSVES